MLQIVNIILKKKKKAGGFTVSDFKTYHKVAVIKTVWYRSKDRHIDQWKRIESPEINPLYYGQMIIDKSTKTFSREWTVFSTNGAGKTEYSHGNIIQLDPI